METHICQACGREWVRKKVRGTRPKYCPECRKRRTTIRNCAVCGVRVLKTRRRERVVCSYACRTILQHGYIYPRREDWEKATRPDPVTVSRACRACSKEFTAVEYPNAEPRRYCSRDCAKWAKNRRKHGRPDTGRLAARFVACKCSACGTAFVVEWKYSARFCSDRCAEKVYRERRRAREFEAWVEDVNRWEVFAADDYVCQLCGEVTDPADFEWITGRDGRPAFVAGPRYPTLDHIVPLAKGGTHERANVQTAHHVCNALKRDAAVTSAPLVA